MAWLFLFGPPVHQGVGTFGAQPQWPVVDAVSRIHAPADLVLSGALERASGVVLPGRVVP